MKRRMPGKTDDGWSYDFHDGLEVGDLAIVKSWHFTDLEGCVVRIVGCGPGGNRSFVYGADDAHYSSGLNYSFLQPIGNHSAVDALAALNKEIA